MKPTILVVLLIGLSVLAGCIGTTPAVPPVTAPPAATPAAPAPRPATATTAAPAPASSPSARPTTAAATGAPAGTSTAAAAAGSTLPAPTVPPGFTTHRDPYAGFAIDYPAAWFITVPPVETRPQAQAYTASIRSVPPYSAQPRGQELPPGAAAIDVTVWRTRATSFDEAVSERRDEIRNSELGTRITSEEILTLAGGLRAVRWQLETSQMGTAAELTTLLGTNRIMVNGIGNLAGFDRIARSLRPEGTVPSSGGAPAATLATAGGQIYSDAPLGFSLPVPSDWELCQNTGWSRLFCRRQAAATGPAFPRFYVTVLPQGFANTDATAYNFVPEEHVKGYIALPVGENRATDGAPGYSTFTRLPDMTVAGLPGAVIENSRVWEGKETTRDRRVLVKVGTSTFMFGTYYDTDAELEEFGRVLAGVKITAR